MSEVPLQDDGVASELTALIELLGRQTTEGFRTGVLPPSFVHDRVADGFVALMYAPWFEDGCWRGGSEEWVAGNAQAAEYYAAQGGATWSTHVLSVLPADGGDEAVVTYLVDCAELATGRRTQAMFLERWVRAADGWRLRRHLSEKA